MTVACAEYVVRWVLTCEVITRRIPYEGSSMLIGSVPCQDVSRRQEICVDSDERPIGRSRPLANMGHRRWLDSHRNGAAHSRITGGIPRARSERVASGRGRRGIPYNGKRRKRNLGSQRRAVEKKLHAN